jgi:SAM-dependent methyltransferase
MSILDKERSENLYNAESYKNNTNNWEDDVSVFRAEAFLNALAAASLTGKVESILDVGCGSGGVLAEMAGNAVLSGARMEGIDISTTAIDIANKLAKHKSVEGRVTYALRSITEIPKKPKYTVVSMIHVLEHCPDMLEMLEECASRGEYVYINVPLEFNLFYAMRRNIPAQQYNKYGHLHFFDESFVVTWLDRNGYDVVGKSYSRDYMIKKPGLTYKIFQTLRTLCLSAFGPLNTIWLLSGLSGGYLVRKRVRPTST